MRAAILLEPQRSLFTHRERPDPEAVLSQWLKWRSERDFFRFVDAHLRPYFLNLFSSSQLNRRMHP
jgi:hypothetical protein